MTRSPNLPAAQLSPRVMTILGQARRLVDMVDTAEDVSHVLQGVLESELRWSSLELGEVVRTVVHDSAERSREQGCQIRLVIDEAVWGEWDPARTRRMVSSLLHNALQYAPRRPVTITVRTSGECGYIEVSDRGPGIQDSDLVRLENRTRTPVRTASGSGAGLWLAANVARAMGGSLSGNRLPDGGSSFLLELPLSPPTQPIERIGPRAS
jgi:two-component system, OmpR family, sensor kinase